MDSTARGSCTREELGLVEGGPALIPGIVITTMLDVVSHA